jgi:hypothetical protein
MKVWLSGVGSVVVGGDWRVGFGDGAVRVKD